MCLQTKHYNIPTYLLTTFDPQSLFFQFNATKTIPTACIYPNSKTQHNG